MTSNSEHAERYKAPSAQYDRGQEERSSAASVGVPGNSGASFENVANNLKTEMQSQDNLQSPLADPRLAKGRSSTSTVNGGNSGSRDIEVLYDSSAANRSNQRGIGPGPVRNGRTAPKQEPYRRKTEGLYFKY